MQLKHFVAIHLAFVLHVVSHLHLVCAIPKEIPMLHLERPVVPDFLVVGQQKAGTSSLAAAMNWNPQIQPTQQKEMLYFTHNDGTEQCSGILFYLKRFQSSLRPPHTKQKTYKGEYSASYFSCTCCPRILKMVNPSLKVIILLREPISRAKSRFDEQEALKFAPFRNKIARYGFNFTRFADAEMHRIKTCLAHMALVTNPKFKETIEIDCLFYSNILGWSAYSIFLKNWLRHFSPEQILLLYSHEMEYNLSGALSQVEDFLKIKHVDLPPAMATKKFNVKKHYGWSRATEVDLSTTVEASQNDSRLANEDLISFYRPYMAELKSLVKLHGLKQPSKAGFYRYWPDLEAN